MSTVTERARVQRTVAALATCFSLGIAGCAAQDAASSSTAMMSGRKSTSIAKASSGVGGANTAEVVAASNAFLATLSDEQRGAVIYDFDDPAKKTGWSNLPTPVPERNGLMLGDLTAEQDAAAMKVMEAALSEQGYEDLVEIRIANDYLAAIPTTGTQTATATGTQTATATGTQTATATDAQTAAAPVPGRPVLGSQYYYIAFFGQPSRKSQFMVQYGGHHDAHNLTYAGDNVSLSPTLTGVDPSQFEWEGETYAALEDKRNSTMAAIEALSPEELAAAELDASYDDLLLGPGNDGPYPAQPEGVLVGDLTKSQQKKVTDMLRAWVDDVDEQAAARLLAKYVSEFDETYISWSGSTTIDSLSTYIRLDGPSAWIEFSNEAGERSGQIHQHTIFRDETADYGWN